MRSSRTVSYAARLKSFLPHRLRLSLIQVRASLVWLWHLRYQLIFGQMQQTNHSATSEVDHTTGEKEVERLGGDGLKLINHTYSTLSVTTATSASLWRFNSVVLANHLYLVISGGYLLFNLFRITTEFSASHVQIMLFTDITLVTLATLFVIDSFMFAQIHAENARKKAAAQETRRLKRNISSHPSQEVESIELIDNNKNYRLTTNSTSSSTSTASTVRIEVAPAAVPSATSLNRTVPSGLPRHYPSLWSCSEINRLFLSDKEGVAEFLNLIGSFGYLLTALIPWLYFIVNETTERSLDRAANLIDNCSMAIFVIDSWLYFHLWRIRPKKRGTLKQPSDQPIKRQVGLVKSDSDTDLAQPEEQETLIDVNLHPHPSSSSSSFSSTSTHRSPCDSRDRDADFWINVCNIFAGTFYLASTLYGFYIRLRATEDLELIRSLAAKMDQQPNSPSTTEILKPIIHQHRAHGLLNSLYAFTGANSDLLKSASSLLHADSTFTAWEAEIENEFHQQRCIAFIGDFFYFLCAIGMEISFYRRMNKQRRRMKEEQTSLVDDLTAHPLVFESDESDDDDDDVEDEMELVVVNPSTAQMGIRISHEPQERSSTLSSSSTHESPPTPAMNNSIGVSSSINHPSTLTVTSSDSLSPPLAIFDSKDPLLSMSPMSPPTTIPFNSPTVQRQQ